MEKIVIQCRIFTITGLSWPWHKSNLSDAKYCIVCITIIIIATHNEFQETRYVDFVEVTFIIILAKVTQIAI